MAKRPKPRTVRHTRKTSGRAAITAQSAPASLVAKMRRTVLHAKRTVAQTLKARFDAAHVAGMKSLKAGDYEGLGRAIARESAIIGQHRALIGNDGPLKRAKR